MLHRNSIRKISYHALRLVPFKTLLKYSKQNVIFPFYHLVSDNPPTHVRHLYKTISSAQFENDLDFLLKYYAPGTIDDTLKYTNTKKRNSKPFFFLSFDDGMRECYDIIMPILKRKGISAAFFINSNFVNNNELFHKHKCSLLIEALNNTANKDKIVAVQQILKISQNDIFHLSKKIRTLNYFDQKIINELATILEINFDDYLAANKPYMTLEQIKDLSDMGFTIGMHSIDHPEFYLIDEKKMKEQTEGCLSYLENQLGIQNRYFAFPFTDDQTPGSFFNYLYYKINIDLSFGTAGLKNDVEPKHLQRIPLEVDEYNGAGEIIRAEYSYYLAKALLAKNRVVRQ